MINIINDRFSCRVYNNKHIGRSVINALDHICHVVNKKSGLLTMLVEEGRSGLGTIATFGTISGARSAILLKGDPNDDNLLEKIGYYGAEILLEATKFGLNTCFMTSTYSKQGFLNYIDNEELIAVIIIGYGEKKSTFIGTFANIFMKKGKKSISERFNGTLDTRIEKGLNCVLKAPSAMNKQGTTFDNTSGNLVAKVGGTKPQDIIDMGIAKKFFEIGAEGCFELGNDGKFIEKCNIEN